METDRRVAVHSALLEALQSRMGRLEGRLKEQRAQMRQLELLVVKAEELLNRMQRQMESTGTRSQTTSTWRR